MVFYVISLFPDYFTPLVQHGVCARAFDEKKAELHLINPRDYGLGNYKKVDERPAGGGPGMVMMAEPLAKCISQAKAKAKARGLQSKVVYMSPQGAELTDSKVSLEVEASTTLILLCGRYEGVDERLIEALVDEEWSIGSYVLSGGELPALVVMDALIRKIPGVLGDPDSAVLDSYADGLMDYPQYTKPDVVFDKPIPEVLKSGNHKKIAKWRFLEQYTRTKKRRPDLLTEFKPTKQQAKWLEALDQDL